MLHNRFRMLRNVLVSLGILSLSLAAWPQTPPEPMPRVPVPESAFVSKTQYTNAFFGFRLSLPEKHFQIVDLSESNKALQHFLFAEKSGDRGITLLIISATQVLGNPDIEAQKAVFLPGEQGSKGPEGLDLGGRLFWKNRTEEKTFAGKVYRLRYATGLRGFVIVFSVSAQNGRLADDLQQDIESIKFFDPATAKEEAGADSYPYLTEAVRLRLENAPKLELAHLDPGNVSGNVYSNAFLGFSYRFPADWHVTERVDRLFPKDSSQSSRSNAVNANKGPGPAEECTRVLGEATKYPQDDREEHFNPSVAILAADPGCFTSDSKFPTSIHDNEAIQLFGQSLVRSFAGTPFLGRNASRLIAADLSGHVFMEMPSGSAVPIPGSTLLRKVHMSLVLTSLRQYWVIWLMQSDTESELGRLMRTSVSFIPPAPSTVPETH
jgi:hypothetical protein